MIVYKLTNIYNGKIYVGQTKFSVEKRFKEHAKADSLIGYAIRKHGAEHFLLEVLETCETREEAYELEIFFIEKFNCMAPNGYNLTKGGMNYPQFEYENRTDWIITYTSATEKLLKEVTSSSILRIFFYLSIHQSYDIKFFSDSFFCRTNSMFKFLLRN